MSKPWRDPKINVQLIMFLNCLSVRILVFVIGALQMESSGVKGISDVALEQGCLCHWIKLPFQLLKSSTSELVRHRKSHHRVLCQEYVWQMITFGAILTWDQALFIFLLLLLLLWLEREKSNAWYIHLTSRQPLPNLHNIISTQPVMLLADQRLPDGNQILVRIMSLLNLRKRNLIFKYLHVQMALISNKMF